MRTVLTYETTTPDDLRGQSQSVADMGPAIQEFEQQMSELGHKGNVVVRHVRTKAPNATAPTPPPNGRAAATVATEAG